MRVGGPALPYDPTYHLLWRLDKIRALFTQTRPDVLEINSPYLAAVAALSAPRTSYGVRTFNWHADFIDTYLRVMLERRVASRTADVALEPFWAMVRGIAGACDATFVAGKWQVDKLRSHGVARVVHMPFGVEKSVFRPALRSEARRRELMPGAPANATLLVGVGRFAVEKRWDVVLTAFRKVRATRHAVLVLFGDGPERAAMEAQVARERASAGAQSQRGSATQGGHYDDIRIMGFEKDRVQLASALASADALVHGCPFETFGFGVAEAMCAGLPVVVPDEGGAAESADEACGELYRAGDADACAAAIVRLLARDRDVLRANAEKARERIGSVDDYFARLVEVYAELLSSARTRR